MNNRIKKHTPTLLSLVVIVPLGFYTKFYHGPAAEWVNNSLGGVFYETFWCLALFLFFRKMSPLKIALLVFSITCFLEFLQLCHSPILDLIRKNFIGRTILGNSFALSDFFYYIVGSILGWRWLTFLNKLNRGFAV